MDIEFDVDKNRENERKHGLRFEDVHKLDWHNALYLADSRQDYGENRFQTYVPGEDGLYFVALTCRGNRIRIISFRRANKREKRLYDDTRI